MLSGGINVSTKDDKVVRKSKCLSMCNELRETCTDLDEGYINIVSVYKFHFRTIKI